MAFGSSWESSHPRSNSKPQRLSFQVSEAGSMVMQKLQDVKVKFYINFLSDHKGPPSPPLIWT